MLEAPAHQSSPLVFGASELFNRDPDAWFRHFLDAHGRRLHAFVRRRVHNEADAADIVQQTLLTAWLALPSFRGESLVSTWVFGIARHAVMEHFRAHTRVMRSGDDEAAALLAIEGTDDPYRNLVHEQRLAIIRRLLPGLPAGHRDAWKGVVELGWAYAEVATQLHVPVGTIRSRVSRVRAAMRLAVEQAEQGSAHQ